MILIYFIGRYFYRLAKEYEKHKWGYAIMGVVTYYGTMFLCGVIIGVVIGIVDPTVLDGVSDIALDIMLIPFGLVAAWLLYYFLERKWKNEESDNSSDDFEKDILDAGL